MPSGSGHLPSSEGEDMTTNGAAERLRDSLPFARPMRGGKTWTGLIEDVRAEERCNLITQIRERLEVLIQPELRMRNIGVRDALAILDDLDACPRGMTDRHGPGQ